MEEINKFIFEFIFKNKKYTLSTSLINGKLKIVCKDSNSKTYENTFNLQELMKLSQYFQPTHTLEKIQEYTNNIIQGEKIGITQSNKILYLILFLINNDKISIPLLEKNDLIQSESSLKQIVDELKIRLMEEKNKNKILFDENQNLKKKLNEIIIENKKVLNYENQIETLKMEITKKNKEIEKYQSYEKINLNNSIDYINPGEKALSINFVSMGNQDIGHYSLVCKNTDLFVRLEERLYKDFPKFKEYDTFFKVNTRGIKRFKTLDENNIKSNDIISIFIIDS